VLLYDSPISGNCYKVRLLLAHLGIAYERRTMDVIDRSDRPDVLGGLNPALRVPTLVLDDGRPLAESNAIVWYFGDGTSYIPESSYDRAQVLQWMFFEQYDHEPTIAVCRFWLTFSGRPDGLGPRLAELQQGGNRALGAMERRLADHSFLVAERFTIADISLYAYTHSRTRAASTSLPTRASRRGWGGWQASRATSPSTPDRSYRRPERSREASSAIESASPRGAPSQSSTECQGTSGGVSGYRGSRCWWKCGMPVPTTAENTRSAPATSVSTRASRAVTRPTAAASSSSRSASEGACRRVTTSRWPRYGAGRPSSGSGGTWNAATSVSS
jgi:glutathione S-transferase